MRRSIPAELKAKVAMEAIKGQKTINEIASIYEVQPNQVCAWKKQVQESAVALFSKTKEKATKESDDIKDNLYHKIGQLEIENEFLKKVASITTEVNQKRELIEKEHPAKITTRNAEHELYPYLLRNMTIDRCNQVWSTDITYIPMNNGYMYLCAIIDWHSRYILAWGISNTHDSEFCQELLKEAISKYGTPEIFNTDQGSEFTAKGFVDILKENNIQISMDSKGRALDNIFIERFWFFVFIRSFRIRGSPFSTPCGRS